MVGPSQYYVYILASDVRGTLYIGVTNDIVRRVSEHREKTVKGFTSRYGVSRLVHFEVFEEIERAIQREKRMKKWKREWKVNLIERLNPEWHDLCPRLF